MAGQVAGDPTTEYQGIVLSTTCTGWSRNVPEPNSSARVLDFDKEDEDAGFEPQLHLVLYSDGTTHWEDLQGYARDPNSSFKWRWG